MKSTRAGDKHFTSSIWIITKTLPRKVLLIHHKKLGKWIQPGGHIERDENPVEAAVREAREETGIDISFFINVINEIDINSTRLPIPQYFLEETIPKTPTQPAHFHLDLMYVIEVDEKPPVKNDEETLGIGWFTKKEALKLSLYKDSINIINELL